MNAKALKALQASLKNFRNDGGNDDDDDGNEVKKRNQKIDVLKT